MTAAPSSAIARNAIVIIAVILGGAALRWLGAILTPLLLAVFLAIMVDALSRVILRRVPLIPAGAAILLAIGLSGGALVLCATVVGTNASGFVASLGKAEPKINLMIS